MLSVPAAGVRETPFGQIFRLITACQANGFRKFAMKAMNQG